MGLGRHQEILYLVHMNCVVDIVTENGYVWMSLSQYNELFYVKEIV